MRVTRCSGAGAHRSFVHQQHLRPAGPAERPRANGWSRPSLLRWHGCQVLRWHGCHVHAYPAPAPLAGHARQRTLHPPRIRVQISPLLLPLLLLKVRNSTCRQVLHACNCRQTTSKPAAARQPRASCAHGPRMTFGRCAHRPASTEGQLLNSVTSIQRPVHRPAHRDSGQPHLRALTDAAAASVGVCRQPPDPTQS